MIENLIKDIDKLDAKSVNELIGLTEEYPYCQALQLLYAVALANVHSTRLNQQVERAAVTMPDRMKLCQMVSNGEFEWINLMNEIEKNKMEEMNDLLSDDFVLIERYLDNLGEVPHNATPYDITSAAISDYALDTDDEDSLSSIIDLPDDGDETASIIDKFISAEENGELFVPHVLKDLDSEIENDEEFSLKKIREKAFLSESLAKIYVKQHKYEQAIAIFSALNLKYSKKYTYFADQIRYLETILEYQNGENKTKNNN